MLASTASGCGHVFPMACFFGVFRPKKAYSGKVSQILGLVPGFGGRSPLGMELVGLVLRAFLFQLDSLKESGGSLLDLPRALVVKNLLGLRK